MTYHGRRYTDVCWRINAIFVVLGWKNIDGLNVDRTKKVMSRLQSYTQLLVREEVHKCLKFLFLNGDREDRLILLDSMLEGVTVIMSERAKAAEALKASATSPRHLTSSPERSPRATTDVERSAYALDGTHCRCYRACSKGAQLWKIFRARPLLPYPSPRRPPILWNLVLLYSRTCHLSPDSEKPLLCLP